MFWIPEKKDRCHAHLLAAKPDRWKGNVHCASFYDDDCHEWSDWKEYGSKDMPINDDLLIGGESFGLLLDLDAGTLSLFLDGSYVGLIKDGRVLLVHLRIFRRGHFHNIKEGSASKGNPQCLSNTSSYSKKCLLSLNHSVNKTPEPSTWGLPSSAPSREQRNRYQR